jgi:hypothetical protein
MTREEKITEVAKAIFVMSCMITEDTSAPIMTWDKAHPDQQTQYELLAKAAIERWETL